MRDTLMPSSLMQLVAWDDVNGTSMVKWGIVDPVMRSLKLLNTQSGASYPVIAMSGDKIGVVALQPDRPKVLRTIQSAAAH